MTNRSLRALRRSTGYAVASNGMTSRALRIASRSLRKNEDKAVQNEKKRKRTDNNSTETHLSPNPASLQTTRIMTRKDCDAFGKGLRIPKRKKMTLTEKIMPQDTDLSHLDDFDSLGDPFVTKNSIDSEYRPSDVSIQSDNSTLGTDKPLSILKRQLCCGNKTKHNHINLVQHSPVTISTLKANTNIDNSYAKSNTTKDHTHIPTTIHPIVDDGREKMIKAQYSPRLHGTIEKIDDIITAFKMPKSTKSNLPSSLELQKDNLKDLSPKRYSNLVSISIKCIKILINILCPGPNQNDMLNSIINSNTFSRFMSQKIFFLLFREIEK